MSEKVEYKAVNIYLWGLVSLSCCAPSDMLLDDVTQAVNLQHPTGLSHGWEFAADEDFVSGDLNPCQCEQDDTRLHYLFHC